MSDTFRIFGKNGNVSDRLLWLKDSCPAKNQLINGSFLIWQRAIDISNPSDQYIADRWLLEASGWTRCSRGEFTATEADSFEGNPRFYMHTEGASGTDCIFSQHIEDVTSLSGREVTLSYYARSNASPTRPTVDISLIQNFGTGGSAAQSHSIDTDNLSSDWKKYIHTLTLTDVTGRTIGTQNTDSLQVKFTVKDGSSTLDMDFAQIKLEKGKGTIFDRRPYGTELRLCQRYYQKGHTYSQYPGISYGSPIISAKIFRVAAGDNRANVSSVSFPVPLRIAPVGTIPTGDRRLFFYPFRAPSTLGDAFSQYNGNSRYPLLHPGGPDEAHGTVNGFAGIVYMSATSANRMGAGNFSVDAEFYP